MIRCLIVDDDAAIRHSLGNYLQSFGIQVTQAESAAQMRCRLQESAFDIILLDVMLPDGNGLELCQSVLSSSGIPVIMLTACGDVSSRVLGLEWGADDYVAKPFEPRELLARIHALLRRETRARQTQPPLSPASTPPASVALGAWRFDVMRHFLVDPQGVAVPLSSAEYRLLSAFVLHPDKVLSRNKLLELTRASGVEVNDRSIDLTISRLRKKLGDNQREGTLLRTIRGEGYLFDSGARW